MDEEDYQKYLNSEEYKDSFNSLVSSLISSGDLVKKFDLLKQKHSSIKRIYYPCCLNDVSLSKTFSNYEIIYSDLNKNAVILLKENWYEAFREDAKTFMPERIDMILLLNPVLSSRYFIYKIGIWWLIVCNNYHWNARDLFWIELFRQIWLIDEVNWIFTYNIVKNWEQKISQNPDDLYIFEKIK